MRQAIRIWAQCPDQIDLTSGLFFEVTYKTTQPGVVLQVLFLTAY